MSDAEKTSDPNTKSPGIVVRFARGVLRVSTTLTVSALAVAAVVGGSMILQTRAEAVPMPEASNPIPVRTSAIDLIDGYAVSRAYVGQVEARKSSAISFELSGRLSEVLVEEGDRVTKGQVLAKQDTSLLEAERDQVLASLEAVQAQLKFAVQSTERSQALKDQGFATQARLDEAVARKDELTARIVELEAALNSISIRLTKSQTVAPFDGYVTSRLVDGGETLGAGQQILGLVQSGQPKVRVGLPLDVAVADLTDVEFRVGGDVIDAALVSLRPDVDPVTRTRTAIFELETEADVAFGQTAELLFEQFVEAEGLWVPVTSLKEGVRGQWTVLAVDPDLVVRAATTEILHAESERVFVRLIAPEGSRLIETGPQRITLGQQVALADE